MSQLTVKYAESLGLIALCEPCLIAMAEWDSELRHWVNGDGTAMISNKCPECKTVHVLPRVEVRQ